MLRHILQWLAQKLYPNGRAFRMPNPVGDDGIYTTEDESEDYTTEDESDYYTTSSASQTGGILFRLHRALNISYAALWNSANGVLNNLMPDNPDFTIGDAHDWYRRLGLYDSGAVPFEDMKLAIAQKQSFAITPLNKQSPAFIQQQLQAAGFNVYVYKNKFSDGMGGFVSYTPSSFIGTNNNKAMAGFCQSGQVQSGETSSANVSVIVDYLEDARDAGFDPGGTLRNTFFIGGTPAGTFANVPQSRHDEFRQLILQLKAENMVGYLFINYV